MKRVFVDTSGWLAILVASDINHSKAVSIYNRALKESVLFSTHEGVLLEVGNALSTARSRNIAVGLREKIISSDLITLTGITEDLSNEAWKLYAERPDKDWGIVDCISFVLMSKNGISDALTADRHFEQAGFNKLL